MTSKSHLCAINCIEVPEHMEDAARTIRNEYVAYFRTKPGYVSSTFFRASSARSGINYINMVVWSSREAYDAVVNAGFEDAHGTNDDGMRVLGGGFPEPIVVHPGVFEIIEDDA